MRKAPHNTAFTIIEVLISIAIALLLILGINQVFSIAQQTSGAGTAALGQVEAARAAQAILQGDFNNAVTGSDSPGIVIVSEPVYAYRNRQDLLSNRNTGANAIQFINDPVNTSNTTGIQQSLTATNSRVHRIDRIMFFTRGTMPRQTADAPGLISSTAWLESFVWYGHLALPRNYQYNAQYSGPTPNFPNPFTNGDFRNPGDPGTNPQAATTYNPNNYFASDWILGRMPIVLVPFATPNSLGNPETTMSFGTGGGTTTPLSILAVNNARPAQAALENTQGLPPTPINSPVWPLYSSRYDMAFTSIDGMRVALSNIPTTNNFNLPAWWQHLSGVVVQPPGGFPFDIRYEADPFPLRPAPPPQPTSQQLAQWASAAAARQAPMFLRGCSQFIVEFAGDFFTQDNNPGAPGAPNPNFGRPLSAQPDGEIDFMVTTLSTGEKVKRVRWYGFPRDVGSTLTPNAPQPPGTPDGQVDWQNDVVPVRDVSNHLASGPAGPYPFERWVNTTLPQRNNYAVPPNQVQVGSRYICAWGWDTANVPKPKMIRITIALDDPAGRLNGEQYFEYVFNLP